MIKKCGYVAISGPTNSGKSTLLNAIFDKKISIVSHKVQTTLKSLDAVKNYNDTQIVFIDTPGFYQKKNDANYFKDVLASIDRSDLLLVILDVTSKFYYLDQIEKIINKYKKNKFLIINKIDLVDNDYILKILCKALLQYPPFPLAHLGVLIWLFERHPWRAHEWHWLDHCVKAFLCFLGFGSIVDSARPPRWSRIVPESISLSKEECGHMDRKSDLFLNDCILDDE